MELTTKDRAFQPHALTTMTDSELGNAYLRMLGECKEISTVAQSKDGDHGKAGTTAAPVQPRSLNASEEERKAEQKVWEKVCGMRQARLKFQSVRAGAHPGKFSLTDVYQQGGELSNVFKSTKAAKMAGQLESQGQKETRAFILCADTFDYRKQRSAKPSVEWNDEMGRLLKWLEPHMDNHTMVILFDGRSRTCRRKFEDWICEVFPDELCQVELRITYAGVTAGADPREPKKKVAFFGHVQRECVRGFANAEDSDEGQASPFPRGRWGPHHAFSGLRTCAKKVIGVIATAPKSREGSHDRCPLGGRARRLGRGACSRTSFVFE